MNHPFYCSNCASYACDHTQRHRQGQKNIARDAAEYRRPQIARKLFITVALLAVFTGIGYAYFDALIGWRWTHTDYTRADWISSYTDDKHVLNTRWYTGSSCPTKCADWPMTTGHLGQPAKASGIYSTEGYICLPASMPVSPAQSTALHELAHAVAWETYGYIGHGKLFKDILQDVEQHYRLRR